MPETTEVRLRGLGELLSLVRASGPLTRAEVMQLTGLARSTVNQRLDALVDAGLIRSAGESASTGGRRPERFAFDAEVGVLLLADVGASEMRTAVCNLSGRIDHERDVPIDVAAGPAAVLGVIGELFTGLLKDAGRDPADVRGIGISVPGPVEFATGRVVSPPIMTGWDGYDIPGHFRDRYACPVLVDNDVNAMAYGEYRAEHPDVAHLLMVKVGTGVGCGIVAGGQILRGAQGAAGDIGHTRVEVTGTEAPPECRCGNIGCVEAYAGGWALARDLRAAGRTVEGVDDVVALIAAGDPAAVRLTRRAGRILGASIAYAVSLLNPSVVLVGGQLAAAEQHLLAGIREMVYQRSLPLATRSIAIARGRLGLHAGVIGLAHLLADTIFAPEQIASLVGVPHE